MLLALPSTSRPATTAVTSVSNDTSTTTTPRLPMQLLLLLLLLLALRVAGLGAWHDPTPAAATSRTTTHAAAADVSHVLRG